METQNEKVVPTSNYARICHRKLKTYGISMGGGEIKSKCVVSVFQK